VSVHTPRRSSVPFSQMEERVPKIAKPEGGVTV
jgi:hypothetical protein